MKKTILFVITISFLSLGLTFAGRGCCSHHGGQAYCGSNGMWQCNDGTESPTCTCSSSSSYNSSNTYNSYSNYNTTTTTIQYETCFTKYGIGAKENTDGSCSCKYGYSFSKDTLGNMKCVSNDDYCSDNYGYGSNWNIFKESCECKEGYIFSKNYLGEIKCVSNYSYCVDNYGYNSERSYTNKTCKCKEGYVVNPDNTQECILAPKEKKSEDLNPTEITKICRNLYGLFSVSDETKNSDGSYNCKCVKGFDWDASGKRCELKTTQNSCLDKVNSSLSNDGNCYCNTGYVWNNKTMLCELNTPIKPKTKINTKKTKCKTGYVLSKKLNKCVKK